MDDAAEKRARRQDDGARRKRPMRPSYDPRDTILRERETNDFILNDIEPIISREVALNRFAVEPPVRLRAGTANGRSLSSVQQAVLDRGCISSTAHDPIEGIDLTNEMSLSNPANGRIATHRTDGFGFQRDKSDARTHPCNSSRSFTAGMSAADYDDVVWSPNVLGRRQRSTRNGSYIHPIFPCRT